MRPSDQCIYINDPETGTEAFHPILEFGAAKPSGAVPVGRMVKASTNTQLARMGLVKPVDCEHGERMDQFVPARAACPIGQVGRISVH
jgi:hypothetical protein